jgi:AraC-like DNA-binding protein
VEEGLRERINLATDGIFTTVHTSSVAEAMAVVRDKSVRALLLSPHSFDDRRLAEVRRLVLESRGAATVAVFSKADGVPGDRLLALGSCGVNHALDLSTRAGVAHLRIVGCEYGRDTGMRILSFVDVALADASDASKHFFRQLVVLAPSITNMKSLAHELGLHPSTITSRFYRHHLPSVKTYLAETRMLYAVAYFEDRALSIAEVARRLDYSSPQSFGRHVRAQHALSTTVLRREYSFDRMVRRYLKEFIVPHWKTFSAFDPFGS